MVCFSILGTSVGVLLLLGSGYGFGFPTREELRRDSEPRRRPTGEERMG